MQTHQSPPQSEGGPETLIGDTIEDGKALWTTDEDELITFLVEHKAAAGDGGSFKKMTWTADSVHMKQFIMKGGVKMVEACKNKWSQVCQFTFNIC
jgi:hypothetical protein